MVIDNYYDRDKLYEEVWSEPVTTVATRYGVSDVAIHKACKRLQVPVPPRGYWAKVSAGQTLPRTPLPTYDGPQKIRRISPSLDRPHPVVQSKTQERLAFLEDEERSRVLQLCDNLQVKDRLTNPHPLIKQDQEVRAEHKRMERKGKSLDYWGNDYKSNLDHWDIWHKKILDISVQPDDMPRAYRLLNTVFHTVEELGGSIKLDEKDGHTYVVWFKEPMRIRLRSKEHDLTLMIEEYHAPRKNWRDTKRKQLEGEAGSFVIGLMECANALRTLREEQRREEQLRWQRELERREREERQREEMERFQVLEENALDWQKARVIEQYVLDLEKQAQNVTDTRKRNRFLDYIAWAREKIAWLDPLVAREDPILGKRYDDSDENDDL